MSESPTPAAVTANGASPRPGWGAPAALAEPAPFAPTAEAEALACLTATCAPSPTGDATSERTLDDYRTNVPRWCPGCGDHGVLAALLRLLRDEQLAPEQVVMVSGIGCASRLPHYVATYGFHGLHGRALPIAQGIRLRRPDLHVFVTTGDGDAFSIGTGHWVHAVRANMNLTVLAHDNRIYGLTKNQASPTSPQGLRTNTTPYGTVLEPLDPLSFTLGIANVSFVAQAVDWQPELLARLVRAAWAHRGFGFVRILQRCPNYLPDAYDDHVRDPSGLLGLDHPDGVPFDRALRRALPNRAAHDPSDLAAARAMASRTDVVPVGILYRNPATPCYEDLRADPRPLTPSRARAVLDAELDAIAT